MSSVRPWTPPEEQRAVALRQREHLSLAAIGERLGRSAHAVRDKLQKLAAIRLERDPRPAMPAEAAKAARSLADEIAAAREDAPALARTGRLYRGGWPS